MQDNSYIFESAASFDPNSVTHHHNISNFPQFPNPSAIEAPAHHFHHHYLMNMEPDHQTHQQINWNLNLHEHHLPDYIHNNVFPPQPPPDLLNLFQLPKCSSSFLFSDPARIYQTSGQNILTQQPLYNMAGCGSGFGEMGMEAGEQMYHEGDEGFEFNAGIIKGKGRGKGKKDGNHFVTEKHRRQLLNGKFNALRSLIPNPTKDDRASIVGDAIDYINNLKRDLEELKIVVNRKRCNRSRMKKQKTEDESNVDVESIYTMSNGNIGHDQQAYNGSSTSTMKSSWLQRKSKNTEIDVRIVEDEVTIKLVQQKGINCLLLVAKVFDELNLDVHHVAGGLIGDFYSYLFNNKICEGSSVYASAIANKLIEVVDKQYGTVPVTSRD